MEATGVRWWVAVPLNADGRRLGLLGFGLRGERGEPSPEQLQLFRAVGDRAARALLTTQLISDLRRTRERFARILEVLGEAVTVQAADGRMVYANTAAARLVGCATPEELLATPATELTERFEITDADGNAGHVTRTCRRCRLLAGARRAAAADPLAPPRDRARSCWLLTKATLLDDGGEQLAVNIIEDVTASR